VQRGTRFLRLDRAGRTLATLDSVMTGIPGNINAVGPFDPVISPDGTKLAYWIGMYTSWHDYGHNINWTRTGPVTIWQDARDGTILGVTHYYDEPSWLPGSDGALLFAEENALTAQVVAAGVGTDHNDVRQWFRDSQVKPANEEYPKAISTGELSPAMDRLALLRASIEYGSGGGGRGAGQHDRHVRREPARPAGDGVRHLRRQRRRVRPAGLVTGRQLARLGGGRRDLEHRARPGLLRHAAARDPGRERARLGPGRSRRRLARSRGSRRRHPALDRRRGAAEHYRHVRRLVPRDRDRAGCAPRGGEGIQAGVGRREAVAAAAASAWRSAAGGEGDRDA